MNLLYASFSYPPNLGGGELHLHELVRRMRGRGHEVAVVCQRSRPFEDVLLAATLGCAQPARYEHDGVEVRRIGLPARTRLAMLPWMLAHRTRGAFAAEASMRLASFLAPRYARAAGRPDLVHAIALGYGLLARSALEHARRHGVPFVFTRLRHELGKQPQDGQYDRLALEADAVIALTEHERDVLVTRVGVAPERVHVTGVGPILAARADVAAFRCEHALPEPYVLFLGRQVEAKGLASLLHAAPRVWRVRPDVHFVFAGPLTRYAMRLFGERADPRVRNLGAVDLATKTAALAGCELLCLPSRKEAFGGVLTEAWALGRPVVAGRIPASESIVEEGRTGLLSGPDPAELADRLLELLRDPARARAMGEVGRVRVSERWSWEKLTARTEDVYHASLCGFAPA